MSLQQQSAEAEHQTLASTDKLTITQLLIGERLVAWKGSCPGSIPANSKQAALWQDRSFNLKFLIKEIQNEWLSSNEKVQTKKQQLQSFQPWESRIAVLLMSFVALTALLDALLYNFRRLSIGVKFSTNLASFRVRIPIRLEWRSPAGTESVAGCWPGWPAKIRKQC